MVNRDPFADTSTEEGAEPEAGDDPFAAGRPVATKAATAKPRAKAAAAEPVDDPFGEPAPGGNFPAIAQLLGRYLVVRPTRLDRNMPGVNKEDKPRDRITADVLVCNGEPISAKLDKHGDVVTELDPPVVPGTVLEEFWISNAKLVAEVKGSVKTGRPVIGKLTRLKARIKGQDGAYSLEPVPAGPARTAAAKMWTEWTEAQASAAVDDPFAS
jgi:hypothetical protein